MFAEIDDPCIPTYKGRTIHPLEIPDFNQSIYFAHKEDKKVEYLVGYREEYKILSYYSIQDLLDMNEIMPLYLNKLIPRDEEITFNEEEFNNILNGAV